MIESSNTERKPQTGQGHNPKTLVTRVGLTHWMFLITRQHTAIQQPMPQRLTRYPYWQQNPHFLQLQLRHFLRIPHLPDPT